MLSQKFFVKILYSGTLLWYNVIILLKTVAKRSAKSVNSPKFGVGAILTMKKPHPCGSDKLKVLRTGSDIRVVCLGCGRDMTIARIKLEKHIKGVSSGEKDLDKI